MPDNSDFLYNLAVLAYWSAVEIHLAIICACLTTLKPLILRWFPKLLGASMSNGLAGYARTGNERTGTNAAINSRFENSNKQRRLTSNVRSVAADNASAISLDDSSVHPMCDLEGQHPGRSYMATHTKS
jgi:hypothetical protein